MSTDNTAKPCNTACGSDSSSTPQQGRRNFMKASALSVATMMAGRNVAMAGPFKAKDFNQLIPGDKKLSQYWINSLYARGNPLTASSGELEYIGMPIGGMSTGQVYLSADGQLWDWNLNAKKGKKHHPKGFSYMLPDKANPPAGDGFSLKVNNQIFPLNASGFNHVTFTNQYPMGLIDYVDDACPVAVQLEAYSPFIPLNRDKSSYPVIVMRYNVTNNSTSNQELAIAGWIENNKNTKNNNTTKKVNVYQKLTDITTVECTSNSKEPNAIALGIFGSDSPDFVNLNKTASNAEDVFTSSSEALLNNTQVEADGKAELFASIGKKLFLAPGETKTVSFAVSWRVPLIHYGTGFGRGPSATALGRNHYSTLYASAAQAASEVASNEVELYGSTKSWVDTWYGSTLPYWLLERAIIPINCMQTQVAQRVYPEGSSTEIYNLEEGVRCCPGNCTHVWNYAQGLARVFPEIERECRDKIEYGLGFDDKNGLIYFRYNSQEHEQKKDALDGTCGTIIRVLRESQMTTDYQFLTKMWPRVKLSMDFVIQQWDRNETGILSGAQHNTLDEPWYGQASWLINVYHVALKSAAVMAEQMGDTKTAKRYENIVAKGAPKMVQTLWNEQFGYFIHKPGDADSEKHGSTTGCHIDQVLGESWLHEVGLAPILPDDKTKIALQSLWKYNFSPNVGNFRDVMTEGRYYASEGDAGLVMCTFPNGKIEPKSGKKAYAGYLNECMTGFEWQVSAHMLRVGMIEEGLAIGKAIYDRYQPAKRNPYNEIECSDHYSRAMASYSTFLAACGYRYNGPEATLGFGPTIKQEDFRAAFTTAQGWGQFSQKVVTGKQSAAIVINYGQLQLKELKLDKVDGVFATNAKIAIDGRPVDTSLSIKEAHYAMRFVKPITIKKGQQLTVSLS